jgi:hypothetical protein
MSTRKMTNAEFGAKVGCDPSFASYLRSGTDLFIEIILVFDLDPVEAIDAYRAGPDGYSAYLRRTVFGTDVPAGSSGAGTDQVG